MTTFPTSRSSPSATRIRRRSPSWRRPRRRSTTPCPATATATPTASPMCRPTSPPAACSSQATSSSPTSTIAAGRRAPARPSFASTPRARSRRSSPAPRWGWTTRWPSCNRASSSSAMCPTPAAARWVPARFRSSTRMAISVTVAGLNGALITDPWGLTVNDQGSTAQVFVSNVERHGRRRMARWCGSTCRLSAA